MKLINKICSRCEGTGWNRSPYDGEGPCYNCKGLGVDLTKEGDEIIELIRRAIDDHENRKHP